MRIDKVTTKLQMAVSDAHSLAVGRDHQFIEPLHLLTALLDQEGGSTRHLLAQANVNINALRSQLGEALDRVPQVHGTEGDIQIGNELSKLFNVTDKLAQEREDQYISSELVVLAAVNADNMVGNLLRRHGATPELIERAIENVRGGSSVDDPNAEENRQALEKFTIDLTERAEQGKLDPVSGGMMRSDARFRCCSAAQKQPGPHRGARGGENRHCRRSRSAHRRR